MPLEEYTNSILPLIRTALTPPNDKDTSHAARHLRYLFKQALYGYDDFGKRYASAAAQMEYQLQGNDDLILKRNGWRQQRHFDLGRRNGVFQWEHVFTLSMFHRALNRLPPASVTTETVNQIVRENYAVAWITKAEDHLLTNGGYRSKRGDSLADALSVYAKLGIRLMDQSGNWVT